MAEFRMVSTSGLLGYGFPEASLKAGLARDPHMIGVDGGSTDPGPYYLGSGKPLNSGNTSTTQRPMPQSKSLRASSVMPCSSKSKTPSPTIRDAPSRSGRPNNFSMPTADSGLPNAF